MPGKQEGRTGWRNPNQSSWRITFDTAVGVSALLARADLRVAELLALATAWHQENPLMLGDVERVDGDPKRFWVKLAVERVPPPDFAVLISEAVHHLATVHEHVRSARKYLVDIVDGLAFPTKEQLGDLVVVDNFAKHQALPVVSAAGLDGYAYVQDDEGRVTGRISGAESATQVGDRFARFTFPRAVGEIQTLSYELKTVLSFDRSLLGEMFGVHSTFVAWRDRTIQTVTPLLEFLAQYPERPHEQRT